MTTLPNSASAGSAAPSTAINATPKAPYDARAVAIEIARLLSDDKCTDVSLLDVRGLTSVQDYVILASGTSDRQMRSAASGVKNLLPTIGSSVYRTSIDEQSTWIVVDCVDTVIHIFEPNTRSYYDLESMWGDAPKVDWLRPGQKPYTPGDDSEPEPDRESAGDTDEPAPARALEASEPDADTELTTASAAEMLDQVRATVSKPAKTAKPAKKAAKPAAKKATKQAAKKTTAKPAKKVAKAAKKPARPAAQKKAAKPAKKPAAKAAKKAPAKKAAKKKRR